MALDSGQLIGFSHGTVELMNRQIRQPLLCLGCEGLLNRAGEDHVLGHCVQRTGQFPLAERLNMLLPSRTENDLAAYRIEDGLRWIRLGRFDHFAAGVFWKSSVVEWKSRGVVSKVNLARFQEPVRQFLLGHASWPTDLHLLVFVAREGAQWPYVTVPTSQWSEGENWMIHSFDMLGLGFMLCCGNDLPWGVRYLSTGNAIGGQRVSVVDFRRLPHFKQMIQRFSEGQPKGKLRSHDPSAS